MLIVNFKYLCVKKNACKKSKVMKGKIVNSKLVIILQTHFHPIKIEQLVQYLIFKQ